MINQEGVLFHGTRYSGNILDKDEISKLNKEGYKLDDSGKTLHIIRFLWNNKLNKAYTPGPFQVDESLNEKLEKDAIDMPYLVGPDPDRHLFGPDGGAPNTPEGLLQIQANYAIGDIKGIIKSDSGNRYGVIAIYPDYEKDVLNNKIPMLVSPTLNVLKQEGAKVLDAEFLNLNAVNSGGYPAALTSIVGTCKNGIKKCMSELSVYAAAGELKTSREQEKSFSSTILKKIKPMVEEAEIQAVADAVVPKVEASIQETVVKPLEEVKAKVEDIEKMEETNAEVLKEVATKTEGVDETKVATKGSASGTGDTPPPAEPPMTAASGPNKQLLIQIEKQKTELEDIKNDLTSFKKDKEASNKKLKENLTQSILTMKARSKSLSEDEKTKLAAEYMKRDVSELEIIDNELKAVIPEGSGGIAGAIGPYGTEFPDLNSDVTLENVPKTSDIIKNTMMRGGIL